MKVNREYFNSKKHRVNYTDVYNKNRRRGDLNKELGFDGLSIKKTVSLQMAILKVLSLWTVFQGSELNIEKCLNLLLQIYF